MMNKRSTYFMMAIFVTVFISGNVLVHANGWGTKHGDNHPSENDCRKAVSLKDYARDVDDMKCKEGDLNKKDSNYYSIYNSGNAEQKKCLRKAADLGNSLSDYEVMDCYSDPEEMNHRDTS